MLAEQISGTHVGLWFLIPEHLRLRSWDLLTAWSGSQQDGAIEPRLALQMVHEAALCVNGIRDRRTLRQKGFETLNGLPFVATDQAIHGLCQPRTIAESTSLQLALGQIRHAKGHYPDNVVLLDPHRIRTWSQRQMPLKKANSSVPARKNLQTFFAVGADSGQPLTFSIGSSAVTVSQATEKLIDVLNDMLPRPTLLVADAEHFTVAILAQLAEHSKFTFLIPALRFANINRQIAEMSFKRLWAGYAVGEGSYLPHGLDHSFRLVVQRTGERADEYQFLPFVTTSSLPADQLMGLIYPQRWNIEEFFNTDQALGWNRASTLNLNIRYAKLTMSLIAQAAVYLFRQKLPDQFQRWTVDSLAKKFFKDIDGDIRVRDDTIIITTYNAPDPDHLKIHYQNLPKKLAAQNIDPRIPWLYNFKLDFRFR